MRKTREVVHTMHELKALQKAGYVKLHSHTGKTVRGPFGDLVAWYIDEYDRSSFRHNDNEYEIDYVDGCFKPFVYKIIYF